MLILKQRVLIQNILYISKRFQSNLLMELNELGKKHNAINLGTGQPNFLGFDLTVKCLQKAIKNEANHQYSNFTGSVNLKEAIADFYCPYLDQKLNPSDILTGIGTGLLASTVFALIKRGDEVIIIEPCFTTYEVVVRIAGEICKFLSLKMCKNAWKFDSEQLKSFFNERTKLFILNTPHSPTGKVFTKEELTEIASLCIKWNVVCLSDDVYEFMLYDIEKLPKICNVADMWDRTVTLSSEGKAFGVTGWRIDWLYGSKNLISKISLVQQNILGPASTPLQEAVAILLKEHKKECLNYFKEAITINKKKRNLLMSAMEILKCNCILPEGGYFLYANCQNLIKNVPDTCEYEDELADHSLAKWLVKERKVVGIPGSVFYTKENQAKNDKFMRFSFWKSQFDIKTAVYRLTNINDKNE